MVNDEGSHNPKLGWRRILKARRSELWGIRRFKIPQLSFASEDYVSMIDWQANEIIDLENMPYFCLVKLDKKILELVHAALYTILSLCEFLDLTLYCFLL